MSATRKALCSVVYCLLQLTPLVSMAAEVGSIAPDFSLPSLENPQQTVDLSSNRGNLLYLDFWSAWCEPCREKMPRLDALRDSNDSLEVIGVNVDLLVSDAYSYLSSSPVAYPIAMDPGGNAARDFGVKTLPVGYLIDQQGVIQAVTRSGTEEEFQQLTFLIESLSHPVNSAEKSK